MIELPRFLRVFIQLLGGRVLRLNALRLFENILSVITPACAMWVVPFGKFCQPHCKMDTHYINVHPKRLLQFLETYMQP